MYDRSDYGHSQSRNNGGLNLSDIPFSWLESILGLREAGWPWSTSMKAECLMAISGVWRESGRKVFGSIDSRVQWRITSTVVSSE
jgi:hypothetical protein